MTTIDHGFKLEAIRAELNKSPWEDDPENPGSQTRRVWLGTIFGITPSGKFYMPFACSNLASCPNCKGLATVRPRHTKARTHKRARSHHARLLRTWARRFGAPTGLIWKAKEGTLTTRERAALAWLRAHRRSFRWTSFREGSTCTACGGLGSREAHLDEVWRETLEKDLESIGCSLDYCDDSVFASEYRDTPEDGDGDSHDDDDCFAEASS